MPSTHTSLHCHVVFSTKDRHPFLTHDVRERIFDYLGGCLLRHGAQPLTIGGVADHVHLLFGYRPTQCIADLVHDIKKPATGWARDELKIRKFAWQEGYGAYSVSRSAIPRVRTYIAEQETHHRRVTFQEEYIAFLERHGVEYDDRYLW
jgi:putative transposase